ncbi:hypothetical protein FACS189429_6700 [Bacteroidia bacterium]|nr:hypothetical protein FACS189429_6700 [Bacteroidia bacterium]
MNKASAILLFCLVLLACGNENEPKVPNEDEYIATMSYYVDGEYYTSDGGGISVSVNYIDGKFHHVNYFRMLGYMHSHVPEDTPSVVQFQIVDTVLAQDGNYLVPYNIVPESNTVLDLGMRFPERKGYLAISGHVNLIFNGQFDPAIINDWHVQKVSLTGTFDAILVNFETKTDTVHITDGKMFFSHLMYVEFYH